MEVPTLPPKPTKDYSSSIDTARPFRSVKEAVVIFGKRILVRETNSPRPYYTPPREDTTSWRFFSPSPSPIKNLKEDDHDHEQNELVLRTLKKLETELEETKAQLKLLKERESESENALASLNAELHKNMSKLAETEAAAAKIVVRFEREKREDVLREEEKRKELLKRMENSPTWSQIWPLGEENGYFGGNRKANNVVKKKPRVPLLGDFFFRKKGSSNNTLNNPLYASHDVYFN